MLSFPINKSGDGGETDQTAWWMSNAPFTRPLTLQFSPHLQRQLIKSHVGDYLLEIIKLLSLLAIYGLFVCPGLM